MLSKKGVFKKPNIIYRSYKRPTFFSGMASLFDLYNVKRHQVYFSYYDDFDVMAEDFKATGIDLQNLSTNSPSKMIWNLSKENF